MITLAAALTLVMVDRWRIIGEISENFPKTFLRPVFSLHGVLGKLLAPTGGKGRDGVHIFDTWWTHEQAVLATPTNMK
jgi:hypothetical protein